MTKLRWHLLLGLALALTCAGVASTAAAQTDGGAEAESALAAVVEELNALERWFTKAEQRSAEIEQQIKSQDQAINRLIAESQASAVELAAVRTEVDTLRQEEQQLQSRSNEQRTAIVAHLQAAYRLSGDDFVKQLLNQRSSAEAERLMRYHGYFSAQRLQSMQRYKANLAQLTIISAALQSRLQEQTARAATLAEQSTALQAQRQERRQAFQALAQERLSKNDQQAALLADSERLRKLVNELRSQVSALDGKAFAAAKGKLPRPLRGETRHRFNDNRDGTNLRWRGVDLAGSVGDVVTAVFRGQVVFSDWLRGFGLITIVDHGDGYMTLYGHADALLKNPGDWVEGGEVLARAGNSGGGYQPGIYFELRNKGVVENPRLWLAK
jgi:septal ring factor EnvC (AmiA/AmiB activator)